MSQLVGGPVKPRPGEATPDDTDVRGSGPRPGGGRSRLPARIERSAPMAALWTGFGAAAVGCFIAVVGAMLSWIPDAGATGSSGSVVRAGVLTFLTAQHGGVHLNGVTMHFVPLGLTFVAVWLCWRAGTVLQSLPVVRGDQRPRRIAGLVSLQVAAYALTCAILTHYARIGTSWAPTVGVTVGAIVVAALGTGTATLVRTPLGPTRWRSWPRGVRAGVRAAGGSVLVLLGGGALLALGATLARAGRFLDLSRGLSRGLSGLPIAGLDLLTAPNAVIASTSYLVGPGFAVGVHSTYAPFGGHAGLVPGFPILAGLPSGERATTPVLLLLLLTLFGAGSVAALLVRRYAPAAGWLEMLGSCLLAGAFTGLALAALVGAAGGSLGTRNLRAVGASPWQVMFVGAAEVCAVAVPVAVITRLAGAPASRLVRSLWAGRIATASSAGSPVPTTQASAAELPAATVPTATVPTAKVPTAQPSTAQPTAERATGRPAAGPGATAPAPESDADGPRERREAS